MYKSFTFHAASDLFESRGKQAGLQYKLADFSYGVTVFYTAIKFTSRNKYSLYFSVSCEM